MSRFTFQVWWTADGKSFADVQGAETLGDCQREWNRWREAIGGWPDRVTSAGLLPIVSPPEGPWPRDGEAGKQDVLVRAPERDPSEVAA